MWRSHYGCQSCRWRPRGSSPTLSSGWWQHLLRSWPPPPAWACTAARLSCGMQAAWHPCRCLCRTTSVSAQLNVVGAIQTFIDEIEIESHKQMLGASTCTASAGTTVHITKPSHDVVIHTRITRLHASISITATHPHSRESTSAKTTSL